MILFHPMNYIIVLVFQDVVGVGVQPTQTKSICLKSWTPVLSSKTLLNQHNETASPAKEERLDRERKRKVWCFKLFKDIAQLSDREARWMFLGLEVTFKKVPEKWVLVLAIGALLEETLLCSFLSPSTNCYLHLPAELTGRRSVHLPPTSNHFPNQLHVSSLRTSFSLLSPLSFQLLWKKFQTFPRAEESRREQKKKKKNGFETTSWAWPAKGRALWLESASVARLGLSWVKRKKESVE